MPLATAVVSPISPPRQNKPRSVSPVARVSRPVRTPASRRNQCALFADIAAVPATNPGLFRHISRPARTSASHCKQLRPFRRCRSARNKPQSVPRRAHLLPPPATNPGLFHPSRTSPAPHAHPLPTAINAPFSPMPPPCQNKPRSVSPTFPARKKHRLPRICGRAGASSLDHFTSEVYSAL